MTGIATLPQESCAGISEKSALAVRRFVYPWSAHQENLQAAAGHVPCIHSIFIKAMIVPVRDIPLGGKAS
jgi:hypothetical protein